MSIWNMDVSLAQANEHGKETIISHLGIEITEIGEDYVKATMPVDTRTVQPIGILHGGASVALAETAGSFAAQMACKPGHYCVGLEVNANHIRSAKDGVVSATARPVHLGSSTQVWEIRIEDEREKLTCISRLTMAVLKAG